MERATPALSDFVEISHRDDLFESVGSQRILELSRLGAGEGFRSVRQLERSTGVAERQFLREDVTPADVAEALCQTLQAAHDLDWSRCPAIGLCHSHIDPAAVESLADELATRIHVPRERFLTLNGGCAGFLEMLSLAIAAFDCTDRRAPIPLLFVETPEFWHDASDRMFCGIISGGAAATLLSANGPHRLTAVKHRHALVEPAGNDQPLFEPRCYETTSFRGRRRQHTVMSMNAERVFLAGIEAMLAEARDGVLQADDDARTLIIPHQPSGKMLRAMVDTSADERGPVPMLRGLESGGNRLSATLPTLLANLARLLADNQEHAIQTGDQIVLTAAGISMPHMSDHLARGHALIEWQGAEGTNAKTTRVAGMASG